MEAKKIKKTFNEYMGGNTPVPTRRAEIVLCFEVPLAEATDNWMNAVVGVIRREVAADLGSTAKVTGKWL
jgi:hypothetical protein